MKEQYVGKLSILAAAAGTLTNLYQPDLSAGGAAYNKVANTSELATDPSLPIEGAENVSEACSLMEPMISSPHLTLDLATVISSSSNNTAEASRE